MVGRKLLYTGGFLLFVLSSALCGLAPSLPVLIAFRVAQGIGAALLSSNSVAIVVTAAGPAQRGRALGVLSAAQAIGLSAGPALGGLVLDLLDWRWVFWINVPVGLAGTSWAGSCCRPLRACPLIAARGPHPHRLRPQHFPRRSAAAVGGGPRRDCPAREFRCHGGRDLARTSARAAILRRKGCVGLTGNRMASLRRIGRSRAQREQI